MQAVQELKENVGDDNEASEVGRRIRHHEVSDVAEA